MTIQFLQTQWDIWCMPLKDTDYWTWHEVDATYGVKSGALECAHSKGMPDSKEGRKTD